MGKKLVEVLVRYGFVVRGILYLLLGLYGLAAAIGLTGNINNTTDIVKTLGLLPLGKIVLILVLIGLIGYGIWGLIRAIIDPLNKGAKPKGLVVRVGYLTSGLSYLALSLLPVHLLLNMAAGNSSNSKTSAGLLFQILGGTWVVTFIGLIITAGGFGQIIYGFKESFKKSLKIMPTGKEKNMLMITGKYGYAVRGLVFALIGIFFLKAGLTGNAGMAKDPGEILLWTWQQSGGPVLLGVISVGLIALGIYSIIASQEVKLKSNEKS